ncbi:transcriptional regulator [Paenibacillus sp. NFR01]|uniref:ArsR/SmtB family transcription factor n=1 Tax=Paenibacillus sp. NFR01 TaxID=1566279 RepID=UPI0008CB3B4C|nr:ArsR family transcriptional regulator [Paenibacillus sp. NFR01]SET08843.1 Predicted transcriptional regulator [Paenibacillus sp. NFR01]
MYLTTNKDSLQVYEALASEVRLQIVELLDGREMHIKELAAALGLSSAIVSSHVSKLQKAGLISSRMRRIDGATFKYCSLSVHFLQIKLSGAQDIARKVVELSLPVGSYTDFSASPTCGIATTEHLIGFYDDPRFFADPEHVHAGIFWFGKGYVEYTVPNYLFEDQVIKEIEISMELGSEAPNINEKWPSDLSFALNGKDVGIWTSPGDFGKTRGRLTPAWWRPDVNQYGMLKVLRINSLGTFMDGQQISPVTLQDIDWHSSQWRLRITAEPAGRRRGGLTVFGRGFGNYDQDIFVRVYYE